MEKGGYVYIMANKNNSTLYTGVTSKLRDRIYEHKSKAFPNSFTARYNLAKLVYYEFLPTINEAIAREKQLKGGSRNAKIKLINSMNPNWLDLYDNIDE